ncbi:laccase [Russula emetica]|nr:laccase [Russula emetica]
MLDLLSFVFLALFLSTKAHRTSIGPNAVLPITNANISPDGYTRPAVLAGGTFPGPTIEGNKGDTFVIDVSNQLHDTSMDVATSIHWHGIQQHGFNANDGTSFVTQCPIIPGDVFRYQFNVPNQTGTYWYHSHFLNQYCDGLRGAFVVRDPQDPHADLYDVDDGGSQIWISRYQRTANLYHYLSHDAPSVPAFNSTLINGAGRWAGGPATPLAVVSVQQGKRYRFRLVSVSCQPNWIFSIDNHMMTIIEVEGTNVQPLTVDQIQIFAGQRYSFVLNANQPINNYWIRALPNRANDTTDNGVNSAILRYAGAHICDPTTRNTSGQLPLVETNLHPLVPSPVPGQHSPGGADHNILLSVIIEFPDYYINNFSFRPRTAMDPSVPILLQILSGVQKAHDLVPSGSIYGLNLAGAAGGPHPVHLHGHAFYVVRSAGNSSYNYDNPILRDVVNMGSSGDEVTIRFVAYNPGAWFFHCHINWHLTNGFAVVFAEDVSEVQSTDAVSSAWNGLCPKYNGFINGTSNGTRRT